MQGKNLHLILTSIYSQDYVDINMIHCIVCNVCVEQWDHHCFWLNTCINDNNKRSFYVFFYSILSCVVIETIFLALSTYLILKIDFYLSLGDNLEDDFFIKFFELTKKSESFVEGIRITWRIFFGIFLFAVVYIIFFITL